MNKTTATDRARDLIDNLPCWQEGDNNEGVIIEEGEEILIDRIAQAFLEVRKEGVEYFFNRVKYDFEQIANYGHVDDRRNKIARSCLEAITCTLNNDSEKVG